MDRRIVATDKEYKKDFAPDTEALWIHPEESESVRLNDFIVSTHDDIVHLDKTTKQFGENVSNLLKLTTQKLDDIKNKILYEKERLQDMIILCNKYTDFETVVTLTKNDFTGNFTYDNNAFCCQVLDTIKTRYNITDILGNGYEGNDYVYNPIEHAYVSDTLNTSRKSSIKDENISTYWEYSRISASENEKYIFNHVNFDAQEAKCTLILQCEDNINQIEVHSDDDTIVVSDVFTSNDGFTYNSTNFLPVAINSKEDKYSDSDYIYSSGVIAFKPANYVKISFESGGYRDETIAFERNVLLEDDNSKELTKTETTILETARRHVIKINDLYAKRYSYIRETSMISRELITDKQVNVISLFCNTYLPQGVVQSDLTFIFTINGKDYEVVPVNSQRNGKKIIRYSQGTMKSAYTEYLTEPIKSAKLTVIMKSRSNITPYINNIKILLGDEE